METNEQARGERYREVERAVVKLVEEIEEVEDGDLKELEQTIYTGVLEIGRKVFQCRMNQGGEQAPGKQMGACGHEQHLVGYPTKADFNHDGQRRIPTSLLSMPERKRRRASPALWPREGGGSIRCGEEIRDERLQVCKSISATSVPDSPLKRPQKPFLACFLSASQPDKRKA